MSTDLTTVESIAEQFPVLQGDSSIKEILATNGIDALSEDDLVHAATPSGGGKLWNFEGVAGEETCEKITGILVFYAPRGVLWPSEEPGHDMPLLITRDMQVAYPVGNLDERDMGNIDRDELEKHARVGGGYDWKALPWSKLGTSKNGHGKRCKESRVMFLLREGEIIPMIVRAQPGSIKSIIQFMIRLTSQRIPYYRAVVELSLKKVKNKGGIDYSQIVPRLTETLNEEQGAAIHALYTDKFVKMNETAMFVDSLNEGGTQEV